MTLIIIQWNTTRVERKQSDFNAYLTECNVILPENKGNNDIDNHSMECQQGRKISNRILMHIQLNAM